MKFGIVVFPGSNCDHDAYHALKHVLNLETVFLWHADRDLEDSDIIVLPGGFSYGDYLRAGAIARFSPILESITAHAAAGKPVIGICNGFQMLCEAGLLPGALTRNHTLKFSCKWVNIRCESTESAFTSSFRQGEVISVPIAHGEGSYYADEKTLDELESGGQIAWRYCTIDGKSDWHDTSTNGSVPLYNPNGSVRNIAGIRNKNGNVLGMMPHPERAMEEIIGGSCGKRVFESALMAASSF